MRNSNSIFLVCLFFLLSIQAGKCQVNTVGFYFGLNNTKVNGSKYSDENFVQRISLGLDYEIISSKKLSFLLGVNYAEKGFKYIIDFTDATGNDTGKNTSLLYHYDYVGFPIKIGYKLKGAVDLITRIGLTSNILTRASHLYKDVDINGNEISEKFIRQDIKPTANLFDLVASVELEVNYFKGGVINLFNRVSCQQSLLFFDKILFDQDKKGRHFGLTLDIGLKYNIKNKD